MRYNFSVYSGNWWDKINNLAKSLNIDTQLAQDLLIEVMSSKSFDININEILCDDCTLKYVLEDFINAGREYRDKIRDLESKISDYESKINFLKSIFGNIKEK